MNRDRILGWIRRDIMEGHLRPMKERLYIAAVFGVIGLGSILFFLIGNTIVHFLKG